jgi:hypothetical protein
MQVCLIGDAVPLTSNVQNHMEKNYKYVNLAQEITNMWRLEVQNQGLE